MLFGIDPGASAGARALVTGAPAVFTVGIGRSGLALQMTAMRSMNLGLDAHVVAEELRAAIS